MKSKNKILRLVDDFEAKAQGYVPFTPLNIACRRLDKKSRTILDLGCGVGEPMQFINRKKQYYTVGVDVFPEYLKICQQTKSYNKLIQGDIRKLDFAPKSFDIVLALRVIEHLTKEESSLLLKDMESIARKQIVIIVPAVEYKQSAYENNEFQEHKCFWSPAELKGLGYKVYSNGLRWFLNDTSTMTNFDKIISYLGHGLWVLSGWVVFLFPTLSANSIAIKDLK